MAKKKASDFTLLLATIILVFIGIIMVFSSSWPDALYKKGDGYYFLKKQVLASALGVIVMLFFMNFNYKKLNKLALIIFILSIGTGFLIFTPLGVELKGARRWVDLGFITFMPSDVIKLGSIIYLSKFLSKKKDDVRSLFKGLIPSLLIIGISCGMIYLQKDLGTTVTLGLTLLSILFVAGMRLSHMFGLVGLATVGMIKAISAEGYRL